MQNKTIRTSFFSSPGPNNKKEALILFFKGICMGGADIIPGVSGGTIALITGIYQQLLAAIKSINTHFFQKMVHFDIKAAIETIHIRFLLVLFSGIMISIVSLARLMNFFLKYHPEPIFSLFIGLIAASIFIIGKQVKWELLSTIAIITGIGSAYMIVGLIPVSTPNAIWFIFLSGVIGICAMVLPGLSGAFILLILGKYEFITGTLKAPFSINEITGEHNLFIIFIFCIGCAVGLAGFSRILNWLLLKWHNITLAFLTGLMTGSMRKIWPWKGEAVVEMIRGKEHIISQTNILPDTFGTTFVLSLLLIIAGIIFITVLDRISNSAEKSPDD